jgi:hypothetical protein
MSRACSTDGDKKNAYRILVEKQEEKRPLGRPKRKWVDNIKMGIREIVWGGVDWIGLAQDRAQWRDLAKIVMKMLGIS